MSRNKRKHIMQNGEFDCGIACVESILYYLNCPVEKSYLKKILNFNEKSIDLRVIYNFFEEAGARPSIQEFKEKNDGLTGKVQEELFPAIALIETGELIEHFVIIYEMNSKKIIISDPARTRIETKETKEFLKKISYLIVLSEKENIKDNWPPPVNSAFTILPFIKKYRKNILAILAQSIIASALGIMGTFYMGMVIDIYQSSINKNTFINTIIVFALVFLFIGFMQNMINKIKNKTTIRNALSLEKDIISNYFTHIFRMKPDNFHYKKSGDLLSRIDDIVSLINIVIELFVGMIINVTVCLFSIVILFIFNYQMSIFIVSCSFLIIFVIRRYFRLIYESNYDSMQEYSAFNTVVIDSLESMKSIKALSLENLFFEKVSKQLNSFLNITFRLNNLIINNSFINQFIGIFVNIVVITFGIVLVFQKEMSLGELSIFVSLCAFYLASIQNIALSQNEWEKVLVSYHRIKSIFETTQIEGDDRDFIGYIDEINNIELINFSLYQSENTLLKNVNLKIDFSQNKILLLGDSGVGKSSLVQCFNKFNDSYKGELLINTTNIKNISILEVRQKIIYISSNENLINGTILENLSLDKKLRKARLYQVCKDFGLLDLILSFPNGFNHPIISNGENLSSGQKQRVAIARAVLKQPKIIILDESLSNIDERSRREIFENLEHYGIKLIYISHHHIDLEQTDIYKFEKQSLTYMGI
ncbi:ATP-binding cassette domain-containing protein [Listeria welshimeri]|uniref:peptidase domain-containing ABC transporter n=1 Tax=Listeria welshimeri TaxID=1643 RepID=UPI001626BF49|nr:ABC transporter transmembrane domain-containing protein [Listeria welshimeri]MBC1340714.1 ATP-binding cassette domain-containing protein [Listeria welshimeri]MBC1346760.1 ATP-binding cassette domain-containing protein [Listeria welshimeri]MBC1396572.1 ATP-binding cassette domain-containing protein [Listeria welshimeri]MBC1432630.1 ATP-binding cassette domain-containing protein [Listeria welshimeri]MBC1661336.1 ATP-binding cassette domain-containing protein [Listeria welshimeri]